MADYFVDSVAGNDGNAGTTLGTAWATSNKVNLEWTAGTFGPGDNIIFVGQGGAANSATGYGNIGLNLDVGSNGALGNPITITTTAGAGHAALRYIRMDGTSDVDVVGGPATMLVDGFLGNVQIQLVGGASRINFNGLADSIVVVDVGAFVVSNVNFFDVTDVTIDGLKIENATSQQIRLGVNLENILIRNVVTENTSTFGTDSAAQATVWTNQSMGGSNIVIEDCCFTHAGDTVTGSGLGGSVIRTQHDSPAVLTVRRCFAEGSNANPDVYQTGSGSTLIENSIIVGTPKPAIPNLTSPRAMVQMDGGSLTLDNCFLVDHRGADALIVQSSLPSTLYRMRNCVYDWQAAGVGPRHLHFLTAAPATVDIQANLYSHNAVTSSDVGTGVIGPLLTDIQAAGQDAGSIVADPLIPAFAAWNPPTTLAKPFGIPPAGSPVWVGGLNLAGQLSQDVGIIGQPRPDASSVVPWSFGPYETIVEMRCVVQNDGLTTAGLPTDSHDGPDPSIYVQHHIFVPGYIDDTMNLIGTTWADGVDLVRTIIAGGLANTPASVQFTSGQADEEQIIPDLGPGATLTVRYGHPDAFIGDSADCTFTADNPVVSGFGPGGTVCAGVPTAINMSVVTDTGAVVSAGFSAAAAVPMATISHQAGPGAITGTTTKALADIVTGGMLSAAFDDIVFDTPGAHTVRLAVVGATNSLDINVTVDTAEIIISDPPATAVPSTNTDLGTITAFVDCGGSLDAANFNGTMTLAIATGPAAVALAGTVTVPVVAGVANWTGVTLTGANTGDVVTFTITHSDANVDASTTNPSTTIAGCQFSVLTFPASDLVRPQGDVLTYSMEIDDLVGGTTTFQGVFNIVLVPALGAAVEIGGTNSVVSLQPGMSITNATPTSFEVTVATPISTIDFDLEVRGAGQFTVKVEDASGVCGDSDTPEVQGLECQLAVVGSSSASGNILSGTSETVDFEIQDGAGAIIPEATGIQIDVVSSSAAGAAFIAAPAVLTVSGAGTATLSATGCGVAQLDYQSGCGNLGPFQSDVQAQLVWTTAPVSTAMAGDTLPAMTLEAQDALGVPIAFCTFTPTLSAVGGNLSLSGTLTQPDASSATWNDVVVGTAGTDDLQVTTSLPWMLSPPLSPINVTAAMPTQIVFGPVGPPAAPAAIFNGEVWPTFTVELRDAMGNVAAGFDENITLCLVAGATGTLFGTLTVMSVNGVATFPDILHDTAETIQVFAKSVSYGNTPTVTVGVQQSGVAVDPIGGGGGAAASAIIGMMVLQQVSEGIPTEQELRRRRRKRVGAAVEGFFTR